MRNIKRYGLMGNMEDAHYVRYALDAARRAGLAPEPQQQPSTINIAKLLTGEKDAAKVHQRFNRCDGMPDSAGTVPSSNASAQLQGGRRSGVGGGGWDGGGLANKKPRRVGKQSLPGVEDYDEGDEVTLPVNLLLAAIIKHFNGTHGAVNPFLIKA